MIIDKETNFVYFSSLIKSVEKYTPFWVRLKRILVEKGIHYGFIEHTHDIWCRDYMPVHIGGGKYVGFKYFPDYMDNEKERKYITEQEKAAEGLSIHFSTILDVVMDGGNYVRCGDKVVMTDKILTENPHLRPLRLLALLEDAFQAQVILIPWDDCEPYGHADTVWLPMSVTAAYCSIITVRWENVLPSSQTVL